MCLILFSNISHFDHNMSKWIEICNHLQKAVNFERHCDLKFQRKYIYHLCHVNNTEIYDIEYSFGNFGIYKRDVNIL